MLFGQRVLPSPEPVEGRGGEGRYDFDKLSLHQWTAIDGEKLCRLGGESGQHRPPGRDGEDGDCFF